MTSKTDEDLVAYVEASRANRKARLLWSFLGIAVFTLILIWTTEIPEWWYQTSPYPLLNLFLIATACLWVQGGAQKNEELLLDRLKELES